MSAGVRNVIENAGAKVLYSSALFEMAFSKQALMGKAGAGTTYERSALGDCLQAFKRHECANHFEAAGNNPEQVETALVRQTSFRLASIHCDR